MEQAVREEDCWVEESSSRSRAFEAKRDSMQSEEIVVARACWALRA